MFVLRGAVAGRLSVRLAHVRAPLRISVIVRSWEMVDVRFLGCARAAILSLLGRCRGARRGWGAIVCWRGRRRRGRRRRLLPGEQRALLRRCGGRGRGRGRGPPICWASKWRRQLLRWWRRRLLRWRKLRRVLQSRLLQSRLRTGDSGRHPRRFLRPVSFLTLPAQCRSSTPLGFGRRGFPTAGLRCESDQAVFRLSADDLPVLRSATRS
jgi:hypothetical protein